MLWRYYSLPFLQELRQNYVLCFLPKEYIWTFRLFPLLTKSFFLAFFSSKIVIFVIMMTVLFYPNLSLLFFHSWLRSFARIHNIFWSLSSSIPSSPLCWEGEKRQHRHYTCFVCETLTSSAPLFHPRHVSCRRLLIPRGYLPASKAAWGRGAAISKAKNIHWIYFHRSVAQFKTNFFLTLITNRQILNNPF